MSRSVLEQAASSSSSSDSSPVIMEPPERQRSRAYLEDEESEDEDDIVTLKDKKEQEAKITRRSSRRRLTEENIVSPVPSACHNNVYDASVSRYSLRTRQNKPKRFDESMYNDVFRNSHTKYADSTPESAINSKKRRRRTWSRTRHTKRQHRQAEEENEKEEDDAEEDEELDREMSIREINQKIQAQELKEREKTEDFERRARSSRYALRSRENFDRSAVSSVSERRTERSELAVGVRDVHADAEHDGDEENESPSENDDAHFHDEEDEEEAPTKSTRYQLRERRPAATSHNSMTTRSRAKRSPAPVFEDTSRRYSLRDRSKTHRTGVDEHQNGSPETSVYAEYHKRQAARVLRRNQAAAGSTRRHFLPDMTPSPSARRHRSKYEQRARTRRRHFPSSSSSGSSSSLDSDDDDSDGGMRTSSPWRSSKPASSRKSGHSRADITPIEVDGKITWDSVGGLQTHIEALKEMVMLPLLYPEFYEKYNVAPPSGVLFYGPPGTGKTLLARALANSCSVSDRDEQKGQASTGTKRFRRRVTFYMRKGADCLSKWVGEAERQLRLLFEEARRNEPSIIFFDEIDGLAPVRSAKQDQIHASIVSTLLALMDGMDTRGRVVIIGATNRLDAIDPALRRPGRFDRELGFKLPGIKERKSMLAIHSKHWKPSLSDGFLTELAEHTVGYCGADIKALCAEAALCSLRRVYPQVYASDDKLQIDLHKIQVSRGDFIKAARRITPASHRAVSSFASPLPRAVKKLLQKQVMNVLRHVARHFPLFPLDKASVNDAVTTSSDVEEDSEEEEEEDEDIDIYALTNHADCNVCQGNEGELLGCTACPGSYHRTCLSDVSESSNECWLCPDCRESNPTKGRAAQRARTKRMHSLATLQLPRYAGFPRVLIAGKAGMGQQYVGPALLHALEGLTHLSLDYPSLVADSNTHFPEEALIQRLREAPKCLPCVLYLPQIDLWWKNTSESMHLTLKMMLNTLQAQANLPIFFLASTASTSCEEQRLPEDLMALFEEDPSVALASVVLELEAPSEAARLAHFEQLFTSIATPPVVQKTKRTKREKLETLPLAPLPQLEAKLLLTPEEQQKRRERDLHFLRELRIFLSQVLVYCYSQKVYTPFFVPVDPAAVPNYHLIVKDPMDLSTMRDKLNDQEYTCFEQFMSDIQLIVRNANIFNPKRSSTRHIAHAAGTMKDNILSYAYRFRKRQGYDLFAKCRDVTKRLRAHPTMYGEYGQRFLKRAKRCNHKNHVRTIEQPVARTSARLRGLKAPEVDLNGTFTSEITSTATSSVYGDGVKTEPSSKVKNNKQSPQVTQWFSDGEEQENEKKTDMDKISEADNSGDSESIVEMEEGREREVFDEGDRIFVCSRTYPGINREGGAGVVQSRNKDGTYNVKYILGGSEKSVSVEYIKRYTDDAVMEAVKTPRSVANNSTDTAASVRLIQDEEKMDETDYFDELLWPILKEEGWRRDDNFDIIEASGQESGLAVQRVIFTPGKQLNGESVTLNSVMEALEYVSKDPELSLKCFGYRYAENTLNEQVLGGSRSDEETVVIEDVAACEEKPAAASMKSDEPVVQTHEQAAVEDDKETPEFIYDETRMAAVLTKLVKKTANWSVDKLRDELLVLNKLAYPFRNSFDRTKLMMLIEAHVKTMH